ncbi:saccharopine dehydrogenase family protein [Actinomadura flavalba]|uniref:saccharopine dehydrogenase family protein n=1 Tax=Actinomadura flavalba TaxID=1120938 RepID=UPI00037F7A16|nr:saccharopine dehydrogenase NADP-binding domain-containing protein [Actinomadura flavalba]
MRVRALGLDVRDVVALAAAMRGVDVVVNTVGPFFRFGVPVLRAAIAAGCDYIDICDYWEPTVEMLGLDGAARAAGVTALVGMGASPGVSNLLAVTAARELDRVDRIVTGWDLTLGGLDGPARPGVPNAAVVHAVRQVTGTIRVTRRGRAVDERPLRRTVVDYPGAGRHTAWTFGHPEALTLPAAFPSVRGSVNVTFADAMTVAGLRALGRAVDHRLVSPHRAATVAEWADRRFPADPARAFRRRRLPPLFALATGARDGAPAAVGCALAQVPGDLTMGAATGIPLGAAVGLLAGRPPGVATPETLLDPDAFFTALAPHCVGHPRPEDMTVTTHSWNPTASTDLNAAFARIRRTLTP